MVGLPLESRISRAPTAEMNDKRVSPRLILDLVKTALASVKSLAAMPADGFEKFRSLQAVRSG